MKTQTKDTFNIELKPYTPTLHADALFEWYYHPEYKFYFRDSSFLQLTPKDFQDPDLPKKFGAKAWLVVVEKNKTAPLGLLSYALVKTNPLIYRFGILLDLTAQKKGYCTEASFLLLEELFMAQNAHKVICEVMASHFSLNHTLTQAGFIFEGHLKDETEFNGQCLSENRYAFFKEGFLNFKKQYSKCNPN